MGTTALELAVLAHLEHGDLICAQLARRTGASKSAVQGLLDELVSDGLVSAHPDEREPTSHRLTALGATRLMRLRGFSEQQAAADWEQSASTQERVRQGQTVNTAKRAALEHAVLAQLEHGGRTQDELVLRLNTTVGAMRPALAALVAWECVSRRPKDNLPDTYYLTAAGRSRLQFVRTLLATPDGASGNLAFVALQQLPPPSPPSSPVHPARPVDKVPLWRQLRSWVRRSH
ncbi:MarR family transcriptional regulator [Kribbella sp. NPDC056345]|uniref:MarR family transcriptional regulator n=1 Tax=Kribbella sp. NPDC056345 TaxID=3345789 RepID=UPI0035DD51E8